MHMDEWILLSKISKEEQEEVDAYLLEAAARNWEEDNDGEANDS